MMRVCAVLCKGGRIMKTVWANGELAVRQLESNELPENE
jgi:hypothetical protein